MKIISQLKSFGTGLVLITLPALTFAWEKATLSYEPNTRDGAAKTLVSGCKVTILGIADGRNNKQTIGNEIATILSDDPIPWLTAGLENLSAYGFSVAKSDVPVSGSINLNAKLLRAYTWHGSLRLNGAMALDLETTDAAGNKRTDKFRSFGSKANWNDGTAEFATTLNYAWNNMLDRIAANLKEQCNK